MPQCLICNSNSLYLFNSSLQFKRFPTTLPSKISTNIWNSGCPSRSPQVLHFAKKINADTLINASFGDQEINETEIELLGKPSPIQIDDFLSEEVRKQDFETSVKSNKEEEALAPFLKFFKSKISSTGDNETDVEHSSTKGLKEEKGKKLKQVKVEYYDPKPNDLVVGVVVSGNENKLDVNIGADLLGTMLTKEVLPLHEEQLSYSLCDLGKDAEEFMIPGKIGIIRDEEAFKKELVSGRPVVEVGTVLFAEVLGRTLSGRPLLSSRRFFRRIAWHRVRQIKQLNEPIEVRISEWNTGGLLTRIEGLRAFLPKAELMSKVTNFADLKANVGRRMFVLINRIDEAQNDLIISEKDAWEMLYLREGTLLEGSIQKTFPYGAQVKIGDTNRSGLLHISNISRARIASVIDLFSIDEKVKVLVVKSMFPDKIALSIADLESEPGLFLTNKEKVFAEADEMAKKYRQRLQIVSSTRKMNPPLTDILPFDDEAKAYANWNWFKFQGDEVPATI